MKRQKTEVVVVGNQVAGATILYQLAQLGVPVVALDRADGIATTNGNQRWLHGGGLTKRPSLVRAVRQAYQDMPSIMRQHIHKVGAHFLAFNPEVLDERRNFWRMHRIVFTDLDVSEITGSSALDKPLCADGVLTQDAVIDFPAMVSDLRKESARLGARIIAPATVQHLVREGNRITGVIYESNGEATLLQSRHVITATGAWTPNLLASIGVTLPMQNYKCPVVTLEGELVERITCWMDGDVTLVPFRGTTLVADTTRVPVEDGFDRHPDPAQCAALYERVFDYFPDARRAAVQIRSQHACIKTESTEHGERNQEFTIFDTMHHGLGGLTVTLPGKATLAFVLADVVIQRVLKP
jgi:glycine/D-amino acid oxidase-like deaminating enzyme